MGVVGVHGCGGCAGVGVWRVRVCVGEGGGVWVSICVSLSVGLLLYGDMRANQII